MTVKISLKIVKKDVLWRQPLHLLFHLCLTATLDSHPQPQVASPAFRTEATIEAPMQPISTKTTMCWVGKSANVWGQNVKNHSNLKTSLKFWALYHWSLDHCLNMIYFFHRSVRILMRCLLQARCAQPLGKTGFWNIPKCQGWHRLDGVMMSQDKLHSNED